MIPLYSFEPAIIPSQGNPSRKAKPTLKEIKDGKKIAMKKKINIGCPILPQIYVFYLKTKGFVLKRTYLLLFQKKTCQISQVWAQNYHYPASFQKTLSVPYLILWESRRLHVPIGHQLRNHLN